MKRTTLKILLWLYRDASDDQFLITLEQLQIIVPELSQSGFRSLINLLRKRKLVSGEVRDGQTIFRLTAYGREAIEAHFPNLIIREDEEAINWSLIVFLTPPSTDKGFRYLRKFLLAEGCAQLTRGVYLKPYLIPDKIRQLLLKLYVGNVLITEVGEWAFGDERSVICDNFQLYDLQKTYSGISDEIETLLKDKIVKKDTKDQYNQKICLVFDRLLLAMEGDLGLLDSQFPGTITATHLISRLQNLL